MRLLRVVLFAVPLLGCTGGEDGPSSPSLPGDTGLESNAEDSAIDRDAAPALPSVLAAIEPKAPTRASGATAKITIDGPPGFTAHFRWIGPRSVADDQAKNNALRKGEAWTLQAWAVDDAGTRVDAVPVEFTVGNTLPGAASIAIDPSAPKQGDPLAAKVLAAPIDLDGDDLVLEWSWDRDGAATTLAGDSVPAGTTLGKEVWRVRARAHEVADPTQVGPEASASVTVGLLPPSAPTVAIEPSSPSVGDALFAKIVSPAVDPKGEPITYSYTWLRNGTTTTTTGPSVPGTDVGPHDVFKVEVRAKNSEATGAPAFASVTVQNRAPTLGVVSLAPTVADATTPIVATWTASDPDGDATTPSIRWLRNGAEIAGATTSTLPALSARRGDVVRAEITITDAYGAKTTTLSAPVTLVNAPPSLPGALRFDPPYPRGTESSTIVAAAADPDGDALSWVVEWMLDEKPQPSVTGLARTNAELAKGVWTARVAATDGTAKSAFVMVPGAVTLCPAKVSRPVTSLSEYESRRTFAWDARSCSYLQGRDSVPFFTGDVRSFDPVTLEPLQPPAISTVSLPSTWNLRSFVGPTATVNVAAGTATVGYLYPYGPPLARETFSPYSETFDLPPYPYTKGDIVTKTADWDEKNGLVSYALFDGETVAKTRVLTLLRVGFADSFTVGRPKPALVDVVVPAGTKFPDATYRPSAYHPPTDEVLVGPMTAFVPVGPGTGTEYQIWAIHAHTGAARLVWRGDSLRPTPWRYDPWTRAFVAYAPLQGYGAGRLDPVTGAVSWSAPTRGFVPLTFFDKTEWPVDGNAPSARNPNNGDFVDVLSGTGLLHHRASDGALRDGSGGLAWSASGGTSPVQFETLVRTTKGTLLLLPMRAGGGMLSMARIFEMDRSTGQVTWIAPAADSEPPNWLDDPSFAYDPVGDAIFVHGGTHPTRAPFADTWRFDLVSRKWSKIATGGPARIYGALTFDPAGQRLFLFGGVSAPLWPEPTWSPQLWSLNLVTRTWTLIDGSGPSYRMATMALDGTRLRILGHRFYFCSYSSCPPTTHVISFDLATGSWSPQTTLSTTSLAPIALGFGDNAYYKTMYARPAPAKRAFVFGGRGCFDTTSDGSGLLALWWDTPSSGWQWAVRDSSSAQGLGHVAWDDVRKLAHSIGADDSGVCPATSSGSTVDVTWPWP